MASCLTFHVYYVLPYNARTLSYTIILSHEYHNPMFGTSAIDRSTNAVETVPETSIYNMLSTFNPRLYYHVARTMEITSDVQPDESCSRQLRNNYFSSSSSPQTCPRALALDRSRPKSKRKIRDPRRRGARGSRAERSFALELFIRAELTRLARGLNGERGPRGESESDEYFVLCEPCATAFLRVGIEAVMSEFFIFWVWFL